MPTATSRPRCASNPDLPSLGARLRSNSSDDARRVSAATNPWALYLTTGGPTVLLPHRLDLDGLFRFVNHYHITDVVIAPAAPHHRLAEPVTVP